VPQKSSTSLSTSRRESPGHRLSTFFNLLMTMSAMDFQDLRRRIGRILGYRYGFGKQTFQPKEQKRRPI
jgi:hypothetical protein